MAKTKETTEKPLNNNNTTNPNDILGNLMEEALKLESTAEQKQPTKTINKETFDKLIDEIAKDYKVIPAMAITGLFTTLQAGGTNNNKRSNVKISIGETIFESKTINAHIIKHCKGITPRQLAKIFANQIQRVATKYNITGNSYIYINRFHSNLLNHDSKSPDEIQWCADFQIENPNCPEYIRKALKQRYNDKFRKNIKQL